MVIIFLTFVYIFLFVSIDGNSYFYNESSNFIEDNYVNSKKVKIESPEDKQNLIFIFTESLESSFVTSKNGGAFNREVIPNLEELALNNINFSDTDKVGGAKMLYGTNWTVAGMVAATSGVPLKIPVSDLNTYSGVGSFLPGVYSLGEVLADNGYTNYLMMGSDSVFGGRKDYFKLHGDYNIYDYFYAIDKKWIDKDYHKWWGFEDRKLFKFARKQLKKISSKNKPFNLTILTADTHFTDGYVGKKCDAPFDERYLNSYYCSDEMIGEFIKWVQEQDFYDNTTIIIVGDHLTMQKNMIDMYDIDNPDDYERSIYNVFINSKVTTENYKNRDFSSFDIFPTTLAALDFKIEKERLGLGTNLFSDKKTLLEEYGFDYVEKELKKESLFYNGVLLGNSYTNLLKRESKSD